MLAVDLTTRSPHANGSPSGDGATPNLHDSLLDVKDVVVRFGGVIALDQVSFSIPQGKVVSLIGPNGAGKTTLFNCLSRLYTPDEGEIRYLGESLLNVPAQKIAALGIGRTFQNLALFQNLSVTENIRIGLHTRTSGNVFTDALRLRASRRSISRSNAAASSLVDYLRLQSVADTKVKDLPFGTQKRVELARALATEPKLLLLDEPACGLNHEEVDELGLIIQKIRQDFRLSILLVEHHMGLVMSISDHVVALNFGRRIAEGTPEEVQTHPDVIAAYLGGEAT
ncbi:MAG: ABC transporter ATP-binding protein [Hydrogenophaga sp.]|uniref:ABC transporter ATP-binding protein n=1 Tax=Hydrogenophaga sp. TaxID=1904254 RepID=UPI0026018EED|nr:ABC transporter ATP-binding protein [Hydrogenophaga sp.]MDM7943375.1 ABC transporter ATP-binding protein [Hydrogenophaga sp.]